MADGRIFPTTGRMSTRGNACAAGSAPPGLARGVPGTQLAAQAASGVTEVARPVTGRASGPHCVPKPRSAVPGGTRLGASRGAARTAQAGVRVPRSQGVPSADRPGVSRGGPVRWPPGAGGSRGSGGQGAVVERAQACEASAEWPERAEQRRGRGPGKGQRRRDGCVSKRRDGSGVKRLPAFSRDGDGALPSDPRQQEHGNVWSRSNPFHLSQRHSEPKTLRIRSHCSIR